MDKYTYSLKTDKIQTLVRQGDYETAAKIADTMDWEQERNVRLLMAGAEAYEKTGMNAEAIDLLLRAYDKSSASKRILYKLTELALANDDIESAENFYKQYLEDAERENDRYILRYLIAVAKNEPVERKISILEAYRRQEFEEEWATHLAELYDEAGQEDKCIKLCDEIILWFGVGPNVDRAMELKEKHVPLTKAQEERRANKAYYEAQVRRIAEEMAEKDAVSDEEKPERSEMDVIGGYSAGVDPSVIQALMAEEEENQQLQQEELPEETPVVEEAPAEEPAMEEELVEEEVVEEAPVEEAPAEEVAEETPAEEVSVEEPVEEEGEINADLFASTRNIVIPSGLLDEDTSAEGVLEALKGLSAAPSAVIVEPELSIDPVVPVAEEDDLDLDEEDDDDLEEEEPRKEVRNFLLKKEKSNGYTHERCLYVSVKGSDDGIEPAVDALEEYYDIKDQAMAPVAKIGAEKLNRIGLVDSLAKLKSKDLIILGANDLSNQMIEEVLEVLNYLDESKVLVLVDDNKGIKQLRNRMKSIYLDMDEPEEEEALPVIHMEEEPEVEEAPIVVEEPAEEEEIEEEPVEEEIEESDSEEEELPAEEESEEEPVEAEEAEEEIEEEEQTEDEIDENLEDEVVSIIESFEGMSDKQVLSVKDFISYAQYFAHELECEIDASGMKALEEEIDELLEEKGRLTAGDAEDIVEDAADDAEKMGIRRGLKKKYNKEGFLILRKKNFL